MSRDQFTRWLCPKCGRDGIDSWNKAMFDGVIHEGILPNPWILGDTCQRCGQNLTICYTTQDAAPQVILSPDGGFAYEDQAFQTFDADPATGRMLLPSTTRDADWSRGCLVAKGQLQ